MSDDQIPDVSFDPERNAPTTDAEHDAADAASYAAARALAEPHRRTALFAKIENLLRTSGRAEMADELVELGQVAYSAPHGFVQALRAQAAHARSQGLTGSGSSLEDMAARLERATGALTVRDALLCAWRCARRGAW